MANQSQTIQAQFSHDASLNEVSVIQMNTTTSEATNVILTDNMPLNIDNSHFAMIYNGTLYPVELKLNISCSISSSGMMQIFNRNTESGSTTKYFDISGSFVLNNENKTILLPPSNVLEMIITPSTSNIKDTATINVLSFKVDVSSPIKKEQPKPKSQPPQKETNNLLYIAIGVLVIIILLFLYRYKWL
uniref:Uncharacterized protein n=1 Tax=viral metagenome TaxID=1070528 RepID=A0A6C0KQC5_9ZZZZ